MDIVIDSGNNRTMRALLTTLVLLSASANAFVIPQNKPGNLVSSPSPSSYVGIPASLKTTVKIQGGRNNISSAGLHATGTSTRGEEAVIIDSDFRLSGIFLLGGIVLEQLPVLKWTLGPLVLVLGVLFLVQTFRLSFVCDSQAFELQNGVKESGENFVVGGENRWTYDSFVNYEFFPKGWIDEPQGPILVYFKETQTPSDTWNDGPGASANSEEALANGAKPGQVHFFPALCNCQQLKDEWEKRGCTKL